MCVCVRVCECGGGENEAGDIIRAYKCRWFNVVPFIGAILPCRWSHSRNYFNTKCIFIYIHVHGTGCYSLTAQSNWMRKGNGCHNLEWMQSTRFKYFMTICRFHIKQKIMRRPGEHNASGLDVRVDSGPIVFHHLGQHYYIQRINSSSIRGNCENMEMMEKVINGDAFDSDQPDRNWMRKKNREIPLSINHRHISITWIIRLLLASVAHFSYENKSFDWIFLQKENSPMPNWWPDCIASFIFDVFPLKNDAKHIDAFVFAMPLLLPSRILKDINLRISVWKSLLWKMHPFY